MLGGGGMVGAGGRGRGEGWSGGMGMVYFGGRGECDGVALCHPVTAAAVATPSLALFNLLRFPIVMIPQQMLNLIAARVVRGGGGQEKLAQEV